MTSFCRAIHKLRALVLVMPVSTSTSLGCWLVESGFVFFSEEGTGVPRPKALEVKASLLVVGGWLLFEEVLVDFNTGVLVDHGAGHSCPASI